MRIVAVVLNWRRPADTIACVRALADTAPDVATIVVDNASNDGSVGQIRAALPDIALIEHGVNAGYAGGNNVGIARALDDGADAVLVLNNDAVVEPGCIETLAGHLGRGAGIVAPLSLLADRPGIIDFWTARVDLRNMALIAHGRDEPWPGYDDPADTDYATGSALLIDAALLRRVGPFDERFFLVWEDVDLSLRVRATGSRIVAVPGARVLHGRSRSFGGDGTPLYKYFFVRNSFLILEVHGRWPWRSRARAMIERRYASWVEQGRGTPDGRAIELGLEHGLAGRWGPAPEELTSASAV